MSSVLEIKNLSVRYSGAPVLSDINLSIPSGSLICIIGPNGSGKSTLIKTIVGLLDPAQGEIRYFNNQSLPEVQSRLSYLPQRESIDWDFPVNVLEVVLMGSYKRVGLGRRPSKAEHEKALYYLNRVGLKDFARRHIADLSGGQQQRVFLARALMTEADLYLLDEPFAAVDVVTEHMILELLKSLRNEGKTLLISHHDLHSVQRTADKVILIHREVLAFDTPEKVLKSPLMQKAYGGMRGLY
jgi:manganese/zinc/iron transport system ATP- binding protein